MGSCSPRIHRAPFEVTGPHLNPPGPAESTGPPLNPLECWATLGYHGASSDEAAANAALYNACDGVNLGVVRPECAQSRDYFISGEYLRVYRPHWLECSPPCAADCRRKSGRVFSTSYPPTITPSIRTLGVWRAGSVCGWNLDGHYTLGDCGTYQLSNTVGIAGRPVSRPACYGCAGAGVCAGGH